MWQHFDTFGLRHTTIAYHVHSTSDMARPLRKSKLDGSLYTRRPEVEAQIAALQDLEQTALEARCQVPVGTTDYVSTEVIIYFFRQGKGSEQHREKLLVTLVNRVSRRLSREGGGDSLSASLTAMSIRDEVRDKFVDLLLEDGLAYDDRLDFYEINFNRALLCDLRDAKDKYWRIENRGAELGSEDEEIAAHVEDAAGHYDPFDPDELDKKDYRRLLQDAIDTLPELQQQIVEMLRQDIPIDSGDPSVTTISKTLGKSEKTIRTHRDKAFATLRRRLERKENMR